MSALYAVLAILASCGPSPGYRSFMSRSQGYYGQVADACDNLLNRGQNSLFQVPT